MQFAPSASAGATFLSQAGYSINAGRMADRFIRERGLTWPQIIAPTPPATFPPLSREPATALEWRQLAVWIKRNFADQLNAREYEFVVHMAAWRSMPSPKQQQWLSAIAQRYGKVAA